MSKKKYKISYDNIMESGINVWHMIFYIGIIALFCVITFLVVKYIVSIGIGERPIDTSGRI